MSRRPSVLISALSFFFVFVACAFSQQSKDSDDTFTLNVAAPTLAKDVQVRYFYSGEFGKIGSSVATPTKDNKIVIKTSAQGKPAQNFKLIAYAPGCQFVTISIDDLASSTRQGEFQCTHLNTVQFYGRANVSAVSQKALQVGVLYDANWAGDFFGMTGAISPFAIGKAQIDRDGSFTLSLPDFTADPLWDSRSNSGTLKFYAADSASGEPVGELTVASGSAAKGGELKIAPSYPQVELTLQPK